MPETLRSIKKNMFKSRIKVKKRANTGWDKQNKEPQKMEGRKV